MYWLAFADNYRIWSGVERNLNNCWLQRGSKTIFVSSPNTFKFQRQGKRIGQISPLNLYCYMLMLFHCVQMLVLPLWDWLCERSPNVMCTHKKKKSCVVVYLRERSMFLFFTDSSKLLVISTRETPVARSILWYPKNSFLRRIVYTWNTVVDAPYLLTSLTV